MSVEGTVLSRSGGVYRVLSGTEVYEASVRGRMKQDDARIVVGDRVRLSVHEGEALTIEEILPRRSTLRRRSPGKTRGVRIVAANVDQVIVVGSVARPDWNPYAIDRFIVVAEASELPVTVLVNKIDLTDHALDLGAAYEQAGYSVLFTSATRGDGIEGLKEVLQDRISLVTGPSGVGKSTLINAVEPGLELRTRRVSPTGRRGRHTTVAAEMHPLSTGGLIVDTPGLNDVGLWGMEPEDVRLTFPDLLEIALGCRFDNCRHLDEPDCAVIRAVEEGRLAATRLESFRRLMKEAAEAARHWE